MNKTIVLFLLATLVLTLIACSGGAVEFTGSVSAAQPGAATAEEASTTVTIQPTAETASTPVSVEYDSDDLNPSASSPDMSYIELVGDSIAFEGEGATVNGNIVTITSAGTYSISGTLNDGQIIVDTG